MVLPWHWNRKPKWAEPSEFVAVDDFIALLNYKIYYFIETGIMSNEARARESESDSKLILIQLMIDCFAIPWIRDSLPSETSFCRWFLLEIDEGKKVCAFYPKKKMKLYRSEKVRIEKPWQHGCMCVCVCSVYWPLSKLYTAILYFILKGAS